VTPESRTKAEIVAYLKTVPGLWYCHVPANGYGRAGIPDYLCCLQGKFIALEVKAPGKKPTVWQQREIDAIIGSEGKAYVVTSAAETRCAIELNTELFRGLSDG
jgi:hypothetical protein